MNKLYPLHLPKSQDADGAIDKPKDVADVRPEPYGLPQKCEQQFTAALASWLTEACRLLLALLLLPELRCWLVARVQL
jgi:hypothetical protein